MNAHARQRGALVVIAMVILAGVAAVGSSLAKMQVSGVSVSTEYTSGNKSFNMAETALQVGLKQFKDAECDPSQVTGAAAEKPDGSTDVTQSLGEGKSFKLTFCPMDATCYDNDLMPTDDEVTEAENDPKGDKIPHGLKGKHYLKHWYIRGEMGERYRHHHWRHTDKKEHWWKAQNHRKHCHGRLHPHHNNWDAKCMTGGENSTEEDSINYWMVTAVDTSSPHDKPRTLTQVVTCEPEKEDVGNLFKDANYDDWDRKFTMIDSSTNGVVTFGTISSGSGYNMGIQTLSGSTLDLPASNINGTLQPVWLHATFNLPVSSDSHFNMVVRVVEGAYRVRDIKCGDNSDGREKIELSRGGSSIICRHYINGAPTYTYTSMKCNGSEDEKCELATGQLHFPLGNIDTSKITSIQFTGKRFKLVNAYLGNQDGGTEATKKPILNVGKWVENIE
ncbi:MAG: hypothetical protein H7834_00715 [Magnetococcus sp. YQC-9]